MGGKGDYRDFREKDFTEVEITENVLNIEYYMHRAIIKWQDSLELGIRQGKISEGFIARTLNVQMAEGCAKALGLLGDWEDPKSEFSKKLEKYKKDLNEDDKRIKSVNVADFKMIEILRILKEHKIKDGRVII